MLNLHTRQRSAAKSGAAPAQVAPVEKTVAWDPRKTALIIVDMWDDHWCQGAARRVTEMAVPMNRVVHKARDLGVFVIHSPSTCVDFYKDTLQAASGPWLAPRLPRRRCR